MDRLSTDLGGAATTDFGARLRRRWWVVALGVLAGLAIGAALLAVTPKSYTSTASVLVTPAGPGGAGAATAGSRTTSDVNLDTESQIVTSAQIADQVRTLLRTDTSVADLQSAVSVTVPPNSAVLAISYVGSSDKEAQQGAHAFAQAYLTDRAAGAKKQVDLTVAGLQTQLDAAQNELKALTDKSAALVANSPDKIYADAQRNVVTNQVNDLLSRIAPLRTSTATPGQIISDAPLPTSPSAPVPALDLGGGLVLGLLLGLAAAVGLDARDRRLRGTADVARLTGLSTLAVVPAEHSAAALPGDSAGPVFDRLRNALVGAAASASSLQVADASGHGASGAVALQLARSLVRSTQGAVLVVAHADSALPGLTGTAGLPGLAEVLRGTATLHDVQFSVPALPGLTVVPAGRDAGALEELLQSPNLPALLASLRRSGPLVVETASTGESAGAQAVAGHSDVVVLVGERGHTRAPAVSDAAAGASRVGGSVAGVVLVPGSRGRRSTAPAAPVQAPAPGEPAYAAVADERGQ